MFWSGAVSHDLRRRYFNSSKQFGTKAILAHVDELKQWLSTIESDLSPDYRDRFPRNIYLVQYSQPGLQLICWPTGTRSPSKYPDITRLESGTPPFSAGVERLTGGVEKQAISGLFGCFTVLL